MLERLLIAGSGGQGVVLIGRLLANVAMQHSPHVTYFPSYGVEVRGGTSNCQVVLASREIASPVCEQFDALILMNQASVARFAGLAAEGALLVLNGATEMAASAPPGALTINATDLANNIGDTRVANLLLLGAYLGRRPVVPPAEIEAEMRQRLAGKSPHLFELNVKAFRTGLSIAGKP